MAGSKTPGGQPGGDASFGCSDFPSSSLPFSVKCLQDGRGCDVFLQTVLAMTPNRYWVGLVGRLLEGL